jgi:hypothetical protein
MRRKVLILFSLPFIAYIIWQKWGDPYQNPGAYLQTKPAQRLNVALPFTLGAHRIFPIAWYQLDAQVVAKKDYNETLSPLDLGVAWGPLLENDRLSKLRFWHGERYLNFRGNSGLAQTMTNACIANVHIIPADDHVRTYMMRIQPGDFISLQGHLVQVFGPKGAWSSSLSRKDTGDGACEVFYVTNALIFTPDKQSQPVVSEVITASDPVRTPPVASKIVSNVIRVAPKPKFPKEITLAQELEIPVDGGMIMAQTGDHLIIIEERDTQSQVKYLNYNFWISTEKLQNYIIQKEKNAISDQAIHRY